MENIQGLGLWEYFVNPQRPAHYTNFLICNQAKYEHSLLIVLYVILIPLQTGVLVSRVYPLSRAKGIIQKDDILLKIDGHPIANDGTIVFRNRMLSLSLFFISPLFLQVFR